MIVWFYLEVVYFGCINFDFSKRFILRDIEEVLDGKYDVYKICDVVKLSVIQSIVIKQADYKIVNFLQISKQLFVLVSVFNKGINVCVFFFLKIGDRIIREFDRNILDIVFLVEMIEEVIWCLFEKINDYRDVFRS